MAENATLSQHLTGHPSYVTTVNCKQCSPNKAPGPGEFDGRPVAACVFQKGVAFRPVRAATIGTRLVRSGCGADFAGRGTASTIHRRANGWGRLCASSAAPPHLG
jgi:hypothetical protein